MISYDQAIVVTQSMPFIIAFAIIYFIPLFLYLLIGALVKATTASGRVSSSSMWGSVNYYFGVVILGLIELAFILLMIFPVWLRLF